MSTPLQPGQGASGLWTLIPPASFATSAPPRRDNQGNLVLSGGWESMWIPATPGDIAAVSSIGIGPGEALVDFAPDVSRIVRETADGKVIILAEIPPADDSPFLDLSPILQAPTLPDTSTDLGMLQSQLADQGRDLIDKAREINRQIRESAERETTTYRNATEAIRRESQSQLDHARARTAGILDAQERERQMARAEWDAQDAAMKAQVEADKAHVQSVRDLSDAAAEGQRKLAEGIRDLANTDRAADASKKAEPKPDPKGEPTETAVDHEAHRAAGRALREAAQSIERTQGKEAADKFVRETIAGAKGVESKGGEAVKAVVDKAIADKLNSLGLPVTAAGADQGGNWWWLLLLGAGAYALSKK